MLVTKAAANGEAPDALVVDGVNGLARKRLQVDDRYRWSADFK